MKLRHLATVLVLMLLSIAGCGGSGDPSTGSGAAGPAPESGTITISATVDDDTRGEEASMRISEFVHVPSTGGEPITAPPAAERLHSLGMELGPGKLALLKESIAGFAGLMQAGAE